ncbi:MAG: hypothetical protein ACI9EF_003234 [Pseudohongiellaceae bacterium]|jgi:hypothetical protein
MGKASDTNSERQQAVVGGGGLSTCLTRAAVRVMVAGGLLVVSELIWLLTLGYGLDGARLSSLIATMIGLALLGDLLISGGLALARRINSRRAHWICSLIAAPLLWMAAEAMFSGGFIRDVGGVVFMKAGFFGGLVVAAALGLRQLDLAARGERKSLALALLVGCSTLLALGWADNHVQVGLYPAFHYLVAAGLVVAGLWIARKLFPDGEPVSALGGGIAALALLVAVPYTVWSWHAPETRHLVTYSNGLMPKFRETWTQAVQPVSSLALSGETQGMSDLSLNIGDLSSGEATSMGAGAAESNGPLFESESDYETAFAADGYPLPADGEAVASAPRYLSETNLLVSPHGLDHEAWQLGGRKATVIADHGLAPDGSETAELIQFAEETSTVIQASEVSARGKTLSASMWVKLKKGFPESQVSLLLMDGRGGRVQGDAFEPTEEWQRIQITESFGSGDDQGLVTLRIGNNYRDPSALEVWVWGVQLWQGESTSAPKANTAVSAMAADSDVRAHERRSVRSLVVASPSEFRFEPTTGPDMEAIRSATRNVVFVLMDAFRDDHLGRIDGGMSLSPSMDAFAGSNVRFTTAYSPSDHTGRSMPCLMTSFPLAVVNTTADMEVPLQTWLTQLGDGGLRTFSNGSDYVSRKYKHIKVPYCFGSEVQGTINPKAEGLEHEVVAFAQEQPGAPFAAYTHWSDVHIGRQEHMAENYREKVGVVDQRVAGLVEDLQTSGLWDETLVIITADHGYSLGEQNRYEGGQGCAETAVRVPLLMHVPGLKGPAVIDQVVSSHDLMATILDVLAPEASTLVSSQSLMPMLLEGQSPRSANDHAVFSSQGALHMLRVGREKLLFNENNNTSLLFDIEADPNEQEPIFDDTRIDALTTRLRNEFARQSRLAQALVMQHRNELDPFVLATFLGDDLEASDVTALAAKYWSYNKATRRFLLESVFTERLQELQSVLDTLPRESFDDEDQILLVMRAWSNSATAKAELTARYDELGSEARRWLSEMLFDMPREWLVDQTPALITELAAIAESAPELGSPEERFLLHGVHALPQRLRTETPAEIKSMLVDVFNRYAEYNTSPYFPSLRTRKFTRRDLLDALSNAIKPDEIELLGQLRLNRDVAIRVPTICRNMRTPESRQFLLDLIDRWPVNKDPKGLAVSYMIPTLVKFDDLEFQRQANQAMQRKWPNLKSFGPELGGSGSY